ncbi:PHP domain-containing protein [Lachnospiraceae bacterium 62-35]
MIDLHMHSIYSNDGGFTPSELIEKIPEEGNSLISITDHNCIRANEEAIRKAAEKGIVYISGIEIDCVYKNNNFHMLGYGIEDASEDFKSIEKNIRSQGFEASLCMLEKTRKLGFHITENEMWEISKNSYWNETWTGELFAEVLLTKPEYADHTLLQPYRKNGKRGDNPYVNFYWDFYAQGKSCFVPVHYPQMDEVIDMIHHNHGLAVLAHPEINLKNKFALLNEIVELNMDGIEAFSSYHSPNEAWKYFHFAKEHQLFVTCGSDFHGKTKPSIRLGQHGCPITENEMWEQLNSRGIL